MPALFFVRAGSLTPRRAGVPASVFDISRTETAAPHGPSPVRWARLVADWNSVGRVNTTEDLREGKME